MDESGFDNMMEILERCHVDNVDYHFKTYLLTLEWEKIKVLREISESLKTIQKPSLDISQKLKQLDLSGSVVK